MTPRSGMFLFGLAVAIMAWGTAGCRLPMLKMTGKRRRVNFSSHESGSDGQTPR